MAGRRSEGQASGTGVLLAGAAEATSKCSGLVSTAHSDWWRAAIFARDATPEGWAVSASDPLMRSAQARGGAGASPEELARPGWVSEEFGQIDLPNQANERPDPGGG